MPNINYIGIGLMIAALLIIGVESWRIHALGDDLQTARAENAVLTTSNTAFTEAAKRQNEAINALKTAGEAREKAADLAIAAAAKKTTAYQFNAAAIQAYKSTDNACDDIRAIIRQYYAGIVQ